MDAMGVDMVARAAIATRNKGEKVGEKREMRKKGGGEGKRREKEPSLTLSLSVRYKFPFHLPNKIGGNTNATN